MPPKRKLGSSRSRSTSTSRSGSQGSQSVSTNATRSGSVPVLSTHLLGQPSVTSNRTRQQKKFQRFVGTDFLAYHDRSWHELADDNMVLLLEDAKGSVKGYAVLDNHENDKWVEDLYVDKKGGGRGSKLMKGVEALARAEKKDNVRLSSVHSARGFYRNIGFTPDATTTTVFTKSLRDSSSESKPTAAKQQAARRRRSVK